MPQTTVNPYKEIGLLVSTPITGGLDTIIGALPTSNAKVDQLVDAVAAYIESVFYPSPTTQVDIEIKTVARTAINSYVNNLIMGGQAGYNASQLRFIEMLMGNSLTSNLPIVSISDRIEDVEDNLTDNQITVDEQTPLLLATTIGFNADGYWNAVITAGSGPWFNYITNQLQEQGSDIAYWDAAAMNGALAGYAATPSGMIEPSVNFVTTKMVSALTGALTVTAGKVIFGWIPRIQHINPLTTLLGGNMGGGRDIRGPIMGHTYQIINWNGEGATAVISWIPTQNNDRYYDNGGEAYWGTGFEKDTNPR